MEYLIRVSKRLHILTSMHSETSTSKVQNKPTPAAGKKIKDLVPYSEVHLKLLKVIGSDIADDIPDEHEEDAEFVISRNAEEVNGYKGKYTGWMRKGLLHGRGTFIDVDGDRSDGTWKDGMMNGTGRFMKCDGSRAWQGNYANGKTSSPMLEYRINGEVNTVRE